MFKRPHLHLRSDTSLLAAPLATALSSEASSLSRALRAEVYLEGWHGNSDNIHQCVAVSRGPLGEPWASAREHALF